MHCFFIFVLFLASSCGKTDELQGESEVQRFSLGEEGYYRAPLRALNPKLKSAVRGRASFFINDFQFYAKVKLETGQEEVEHVQIIHAGSRCPDAKDDVNGDGYVDGLEAVSVSGGILIPLDSDLRSQRGMSHVYPVSGEDGNYLYGLSASTSLMMTDLRSPDKDPLDFVVKLHAGEEVRLPSRVVMVYGVPEGTELPPTVQGFAEFPPRVGLPIACGNIVETDEVFP